MKKNDNLATKPKFEEDRLGLYSDLFIRRDQLYKEAASLQIAYTREFGEQLIENFEEYLETLKKALNELLLGKGMNTTWEMN